MANGSRGRSLRTRSKSRKSRNSAKTKNKNKQPSTLWDQPRSCSLQRSTSSETLAEPQPAKFSWAQVARALAYIDVSGDEQVTKAELRSSLHAADSYHVLENDTLTRDLFGGDAGEGVLSISELGKSLGRLLTSPNRKKQELAERVVQWLLVQRSEEQFYFDSMRVWRAMFCFLLPPVGLLTSRCWLGPERTHLYIPDTFHEDESSWPLRRVRPLVQDLENIACDGPQIHYHISKIILRLDRFIVEVAQVLSSEETSCFSMLCSPFDAGIRDLVETRLEGFFDNIRGGGVLSLQLQQLDALEQALASGEGLKQGWLGHQIQPRVLQLNVGCTTKRDGVDSNDRFAMVDEVVFRHEPTPIVHLSLARESSTQEDSTHRMLRRATQRARGVVQTPSWWRMFTFMTVVFCMLLIFWRLFWLERNIISNVHYECVSCRGSNNSAAACNICTGLRGRSAALFSSAELIRAAILYVFLGSLSSLKNGWSRYDGGESLSENPTNKVDMYVSSFKMIAELPRFGFQHPTVQRLMCDFGATLWCVVPLYRRYRASPAFSVVGRLSGACLGDVNGMHDWSSEDILCCVLCLLAPISIAAHVFATTVRECYSDAESSRRRCSAANLAIATVVAAALAAVAAELLLDGRLNISLYASGAFVALLLLLSLASRLLTRRLFNFAAVLVGPLLSGAYLSVRYYDGAVSLKGVQVNSVRVTLIWGTFALAFTQMRTVIKIFHSTLAHFERLSKMVQLFSHASAHDSWFGFYRSFIKEQQREVHCCCRRTPHQDTNTEVSAASRTRYEEVIDMLRLGPHDPRARSTDAERNRQLAFAPFDLSSAESIVCWNHTRNQILQYCNSTDTEIQNTNLNALLLGTTALGGLYAVRLFHRWQLQRGKAGGFDAVEKITGTSMMVFKATLVIFIFYLFLILNERRKMAIYQRSHVKRLARARHRLQMILLNAGEGAEHETYDGKQTIRQLSTDSNTLFTPSVELQYDAKQVGELKVTLKQLKESIKNIEMGDEMPQVLGMEMESMSVQQVVLAACVTLSNIAYTLVVDM